MFRIHALYLSPGHNFHGHHGRPPGHHPILAPDRIECVAGQGVRGDRFFGQQADYKGQITFFSHEVFLALIAALRLPTATPAALRRNVLTEGIDLNSLVGRRFTVQGVDFAGTEECRPCYWMDQALAPGAEAWLKGRGGLRCRILSSGWLQRATKPGQHDDRASTVDDGTRMVSCA